MTDIRKSLEALADSIEALENKPAPTVKINDRELSGNKINGGLITNFSSIGIKDEAKDTTVLTVKPDGIHVSTAHINTINNKLSVKGDLKVEGEVHAKKLHVDEISADIRNERTSPLEFKGEGKPNFGKGLIWTGGSYTKQLVLQGNPDRLWSTEDFDLASGKEYRINNIPVVSEGALGVTVTKSNLKHLGTLRELNVDGHVNIDHFLKYDANTQQVSLGAESPVGMLTLENFTHQFVVDSTDSGHWKVGTYTTSDLSIVTDDTTRISVGANGGVTINSKTTVNGKLGIGVKNFAEDVDLTVAGPVRIENKKFEVGNGVPEHGAYRAGDIVWNDSPQPSGFVGWICIREGTPGIWKPFGAISA